MFRVASALGLTFALSISSAVPRPSPFAPRVRRLASPDVDAVVFALAFRAGKADQFKNMTVRGAGTSFHGAITERLADGSTRMSLVMTLGAAEPDGKMAPINTWDDFVAAERARSTVVVALSGPDLPPPPAPGPTVYEFSGVYSGQVRTVSRVPQAGDAPGAPDSGPCSGEQPRGEARGGSFYCAPLLTGAAATIRR
ncbi:MAG TPA: hypothetical protein VFZ98_11670 [Vicinamibacterales bacterium]